MTPREFLEQIVRPDIDAFHADYGNIRLAYHAVTSVDALAAHLFQWCRVNNPSATLGAGDDSLFRYHLAQKDKDFALVRDLAKAQKHVEITKTATAVSSQSQVVARGVGYGEGGYGTGRYGGPIQAIVTTNAGELKYLEGAVDAARDFLEREMSAAGVPRQRSHSDDLAACRTPFPKV
jgi:hypothetical protein